MFWYTLLERQTMNRVVDPGASEESVPVQCLPLYSLLLALGNPTVDYLSLDTEGGELEVLETLPWDKVDIRAISVETQHQAADTRERLLALLLAVGFSHLGSLARDDVFVRLDGGGISPLQTVREVMSRRTPRLCHYYRLPRAQLASHCASHWPRDFYREQTFSRDLEELLLHATSDFCPWSRPWLYDWSSSGRCTNRYIFVKDSDLARREPRIHALCLYDTS